MLQRRTPLRSVSVKKAEKKRKGLEDMKKSGLVSKASEFTSKPREALKPRSPNNTGWYKWAVENVWNRREHSCEVCGWSLAFMGPKPAPIVFSHLLPRGSYRKYKTDERNVVIKCPNCHKEWHEVGPDNLRHDLPWKNVCAKYEQLRREANNVEP